jgi:formate-dependent nitrite reductase membrane component NrfD
MANELDSQVQREWKWPVAADLFLAGMGAGAYAIGILASFGGPGWEPVARTGIAMGFPLLLLATFFLMVDLGVKSRALRVFLNPGTSWIARGSLIITVFMTLSFIHLILMVWPGQMAMDAPLLRFIGGINLVFSVLVMIYTGALLGASRAIAFWNTAMLPLLFLVSAVSTGIMAVLLLTPSSPAAAEALGLLSRALLFLLIFQLIVLTFYIQASHRTDDSRASTHLLLKGRLSKKFWFGLIIVGLLIPLVLIISAVAQDGGLSIVRIACVFGLIGGFILRRLILAAGIRTPLRAAGIDFKFPSPNV